jgi:hypothetical protein
LAYFKAIWYILWHFGIFYGNLAYFMAIWYILWQFGTFFLALVRCTLKHLAALGPLLSLSVETHEDACRQNVFKPENWLIPIFFRST